MEPEERDELFESTNIIGQASQQANQSAATQYYLEEQNKNLAETQLDVESITAKCYHLLRQDVLKPDEKGVMDWQPLTNPNERVLTDEGVDKFMTFIHFYINKNTLLSNFDEKQINTMMLRFVTELNDLVLMKYEILFRQSSFEECKQILLKRLKEQKDLREFAIEFSTGIKPNDKQVEKQIVRETEQKIQYELKKIRDEQRRQKLREYGIILAQLEMIVFAGLNRAFRGEERGSIRRHTNISEIIGGRPQQQRGKEGGIFPWGQR